MGNPDVMSVCVFTIRPFFLNRSVGGSPRHKQSKPLVDTSPTLSGVAEGSTCHVVGSLTVEGVYGSSGTPSGAGHSEDWLPWDAAQTHAATLGSAHASAHSMRGSDHPRGLIIFLTTAQRTRSRWETAATRPSPGGATCPEGRAATWSNQ